MKNDQYRSKSTTTRIIRSRYNYLDALDVVTEQGQILFGPRYHIHDIDRPVILKLISYFLHDIPVATSEGIDLNKGILLSGPVGCGKRAIMTIMQAWPDHPFKHAIVHCRNLAQLFSEQGYSLIDDYSRRSFHPYSTYPKAYCFADLGHEPSQVTWYGNTCNVMAEILLSRYDQFVNCRMITHLTTNFTSGDIEQEYGSRLSNRIKQMFNLVAFHPKSPDKRGREITPLES